MGAGVSDLSKIEAAAREADAFVGEWKRRRRESFRGYTAEGVNALRIGYIAGFEKSHASRDAEITDLRARLEAAEMVIGNYLPVCIGDCGCEGANTGCAILGDDPEATAVAEEIAIRMASPVPLPEMDL